MEVIQALTAETARQNDVIRGKQQTLVRPPEAHPLWQAADAGPSAGVSAVASSRRWSVRRRIRCGKQQTLVRPQAYPLWDTLLRHDAMLPVRLGAETY